jgi:Fur family ferric uptake transcriptional regulator
MCHDWGDFRRILAAAGLRCTQGRLAILEALRASGGPLTEEQIHERLGHARLNKVTIYRALAGFEQAGVVHRAYVRGQVRYYELADRCSAVQCHPHFTCRGCGETFCLPEAKVPLVQGLRPGFQVERQQVRLEGRCPGCSQKETE